MAVVWCKRPIEGDVGRKSSHSEKSRQKINDIFYANAQRIKESLRVLEEFGKLVDKNTAEKIKKLRYKTYSLEKEMNKKAKNCS